MSLELITAAQLKSIKGLVGIFIVPPEFLTEVRLNNTLWPVEQTPVPCFKMRKSEATSAGLMQPLNKQHVLPDFVLYNGQLVYGAANITREDLPGIFQEFVPGYDISRVQIRQ